MTSFAGVSPDAIGSALEQTLGTARIPANAKLLLLLAPPVIEIRTLTDLPTLSPNELRRTVGTQATRFFRARSQSVVTDAISVRKIGSREVRAAAIDALLEQALIGASAGRAILIRPSGKRYERLDLSRASHARRAASRWSWLLAAAALLAISLASFDRWLSQANAAAQSELDRLRVPAREADMRKREIAALSAARDAISESGSQRGKLLMRLARLGTSIPTGSFLNSIDLTESGAVQVQMTARRAADVEAAFRSKGFNIASISSLSGAAATDGLSRLTILAQQRIGVAR